MESEPLVLDGEIRLGVSGGKYFVSPEISDPIDLGPDMLPESINDAQSLVLARVVLESIAGKPVVTTVEHLTDSVDQVVRAA